MPPPESFTFRDAEILVFDADPHEGDPGPQYVLYVLDLIINVHQRASGGTYVHVDADPDKHERLLVEVNNGGERVYTPEHPRGQVPQWNTSELGGGGPCAAARPLPDDVAHRDQ